MHQCNCFEGFEEDKIVETVFYATEIKEDGACIRCGHYALWRKSAPSRRGVRKSSNLCKPLTVFREDDHSFVGIYDSHRALANELGKNKSWSMSYLSLGRKSHHGLIVFKGAYKTFPQKAWDSIPLKKKVGSGHSGCISLTVFKASDKSLVGNYSSRRDLQEKLGKHNNWVGNYFSKYREDCQGLIVLRGKFETLPK